MSDDLPRPYRPQDLKSPDSYESLRPPPSVTQWSVGTGSGYSSPAESSGGLDGGVHTPPIRTAQSQQISRHAGPSPYGPTTRPPPSRPNVLQKSEGSLKHETLTLGGTGYIHQKEDPRLRRKRITLISISGVVVCGIIALVVIGCKGLL